MICQHYYIRSHFMSKICSFISNQYKTVRTQCSNLNASWVDRGNDVRRQCNQRADSSRTRHLAVTHLCGSGGRLKVFTGTDSNSGGHTVLLFWKTHTDTASQIQAACGIYFQGLDCSRTSQDIPTKQKQI